MKVKHICSIYYGKNDVWKLFFEKVKTDSVKAKGRQIDLYNIHIKAEIII